MAIFFDQLKNATSQARPFQFSLRQLLMLPVVLGLYLGIFIWLYPFSVPAIFALVIALPFFLLFFRDAVATVIMSAIIYALVAGLIGSITDPREYFRKSECMNNVKDITRALHNYYDKHGHFPPAYIADKDGRPMHSWRVLILPYMEHEDIYQQYRMDEPWDGPNNRKLWNVRIPEYECPEQPQGNTPTTSYVAVVGPGTMWPGVDSICYEDIRDGGAQTIALVEIADSGIHWMEPKDLNVSMLPLEINPKNAPGISSWHRSISWDQRRLGAHVGMADGHAEFLKSDFPAEKLKGMLTIDGGENIGEN